MQKEEILDINVKDNVDMKRRVIPVQASKGGTRKMIPMSEKLFEMMTRRLKVVSISDRLFDNKPLTLKDGFCRTVEKAGLEDFSFTIFVTRLALGWSRWGLICTAFRS